MRTWLIDPTQRTLVSALDGLASRVPAAAADHATSRTSSSTGAGDSFASILADASSSSASTSSVHWPLSAAPAASSPTSAAGTTATTAPDPATVNAVAAATTQAATAPATPLAAAAPKLTTQAIVSAATQVAQGVGTGSATGTGSTGPAGSGSSAWGAPIDLSIPSGNTYTLARQWYYAIENPSAAPAGSVFSQASSPGPTVASWQSGAPGGPTPSYGAFQLRQLLDQFNTQGTTYWPTGVYPAIPSDVFTAAGWAGGHDTRGAV